MGEIGVGSLKIRQIQTMLCVLCEPLRTLRFPFAKENAKYANVREVRYVWEEATIQNILFE